jgi:two-component system, response regulator, stage 0 sporulation protein A
MILSYIMWNGIMERINVLIADNSVEFTKIFSRFLSLSTDINIVGLARDGAETMEMLLQTKPDVLLLDLIMPRIDGLEVLQKIKGSYANTSIIVISALSNEDIRRQAIESGANHYFVKPLNMESVLSKIRESKTSLN